MESGLKDPCYAKSTLFPDNDLCLHPVSDVARNEEKKSPS